MSKEKNVTDRLFRLNQIFNSRSNGFRLMWNRDLVNKLASLGAQMKVLKPKELAEEVKQFHQIALKQYEN